MERKIIKYVAIYLRKSRGDDDSALAKHKLVLIELCESNGWKYVLYEEIVSGDSISMRPIFQKLLEDIHNGIYDAVCVVDIDRLGRGDEEDQGKIKKEFIKTDTYVITPQKVYNLNNQEDKQWVDFKTFFARQEYGQIVKRLIQGKKVGSRQGMWTNGKPPYPYEYEKWQDKYNPKGLVVNDDKLKIYRYLIDSVINEDKTPAMLSYDLNRKGVLSPKNGLWYSGTIYRLLLDETHLGKIISNKSIGDGHKKKKPDAIKSQYIPKKQWVIVENCHEAIKTIEEHEKILLFASRLTKIPRRKAIKIQPLSGLIKCGICGHTMSLYYRKNRPNNPESLKPCWFHNALGEKCPNRGLSISFIYDDINKKILSYKKKLQEKINNQDIKDQKTAVEKNLKLQNEILSNKQKVLSRIMDGFENGAYNINEFKDRKEKAEKVIENIQNQINLYNIKLKQINFEKLQDKINLLEKFENDIQNNNLTFEQKNKLYKSILEQIIWIRLDNNIDIKIQFK